MVSKDSQHEVTLSRRSQLVTELRFDDESEICIQSKANIISALMDRDDEPSPLKKIRITLNSCEKYPDDNLLSNLLKMEEVSIGKLEDGNLGLEICNLEGLLMKIAAAEDLRLKTLNVTSRSQFHRDRVEHTFPYWNINHHWQHQNGPLVGIVSKIPQEIYSAALVKLERTNLKYLLRGHTVEGLLSQIATSPTVRLKSLPACLDYSSVPPHVFAEALIKIENVSLTDTTSPQLKSLFQKISSVESSTLRLRSLKMSSDLRNVPDSSLAASIIRLEKLQLSSGCRLGISQLQSVFKKIGDCPAMSLTSLTISWDDDTRFISVPTDVLVRALSRLEEINFSESPTPFPQLRGIFSMISGTEDSSLRRLTIGAKLSSVMPEVLMQAVAGLEAVSLSHSQLSAAQLNEIFFLVAYRGFCQLRRISLAGTCMASVPADVLVRAVPRLEEIDLANTGLTTAQLNAVLHQMALNEFGRLRRVSLAGNDLNSVATADLARAVVNLEDVSLAQTNLTSHHVEAVLRRLALQQRPRLKRLDLSLNDLGDLGLYYSNLLPTSVCRLVELDLSKTSLTGKQLREIFCLVAERKCPRMKRIFLGNIELEQVCKSLRHRAARNENVELQYRDK